VESRQIAARYLYPGLTLLAIVVAWEASVRALEVPIYILPAPSGVAREIVTYRGMLWGHAVVTTTEVLIAFGASLAVGIPLGVLIVRSPFFERTLYPLLVSSQAVPKIAVAPLFLFWFKFGPTAKIVIAFMIAFFPIVISTVVGLRSVEPEMLYLARSAGSSRGLAFLKIELPCALPSIFGGMKVAVTLAVVGAIVGEFVAAEKGLGYVIVQANGALNTPLMFAAITFLSLLGVAMFLVIELLERLLVPPQPALRQEATGTM
jgi:NitT/TauT family transport system permease protein